ncbi:hypothetical protein Tsubulata_030613 [Turnera subulata]|uniref:Uncharacterized protein n=1 Tax=Turnera subulata TaxID=218843 RepID=A0A9Q0JRI5_9ROSI|nr:hypothetical protein Tsubulata_030613 [Turnera subulata]
MNMVADCPGGEDSSSNTGESPDGDADEVGVEGQEMNAEVADRKSGEEKPEEMEEEEEADEEDNEMNIQQGQGDMPLATITIC